MESNKVPNSLDGINVTIRACLLVATCFNCQMQKAFSALQKRLFDQYTRGKSVLVFPEIMLEIKDRLLDLGLCPSKESQWFFQEAYAMPAVSRL